MVGAGLAAVVVAQPAATKTRNVIHVMADGLRWQEAFRGADPALMTKANGVDDAAELRREFARATAAESRAALMPFLWNVVAKQGQVFGNRDLGSEAYVTNGLNFSYPGYSETFCGFADARVNSNDKVPNPNVSVLEWLNGKKAYQGKIAAFGAWDLFPFILNAKRSGLLVNAGYTPLEVAPVTPALRLLNRLKAETAMWGGESFDAPTFHTALEYTKLHKPRVLFLSMGEPDEWAHDGKYALYLKSIRRFDDYVRELWETVQAMPEYRGNTTLIISVDHGRGEGPVEWRKHGEKAPDSKYIWMAFLGPDTAAKGERSKTAAVTQSQIAATLAGMLGEDYRSAAPRAAAPIALKD
jgi:hypothetical protein